MLEKAEKVGFFPPDKAQKWGKDRAEGWKQENEERPNVCDLLRALTLVTMFRWLGGGAVLFGVFYLHRIPRSHLLLETQTCGEPSGI